MADIVGIGCAVFDYMLLLEKWPEEDTKTGSLESKIQCGGPCAVAMIAASKLGISSAYIGKVGDDLFGLTIKERLEHYGVDTSALTVVPGGSSSRCVVLSNQQNASRTCIGGGGGGDRTRLKPEEIDPERIRKAKFLHLDGSNPEAALHAAKLAHQFGVKVCLDVEGTWPGIDELLQWVDVLIPSERCAYRLTGSEDDEFAAWYIYRKYHPQVLVVTQGSRGGILLTEDTLTRYPAFKVDAKDTNGAGDVFHGAWIAAALMGKDPYEATRFAAAASAIKCTHFGASEGAPRLKDVEQFLEDHEGGIS
ncbi:MAG: carbohydrate kinase family protein [Clostridiales bacterium]|nr:carbohydrate kinase family protein [Clostridiales bacterium]